MLTYTELYLVRPLRWLTSYKTNKRKKKKDSRGKLTAMIWSRTPPCCRSLFVNTSSGNSLIAEREKYGVCFCFCFFNFTASLNGRLKNKDASVEIYDQTWVYLPAYYIIACHLRISFLLCRKNRELILRCY